MQKIRSAGKFKPGDRVKIRYHDEWVSGLVTIVSDMGVKFLSDDFHDGLDYTYYDEDEFVKETWNGDKTTNS